MLSNCLLIIRTTPPQPLVHDTTIYIYILIKKIIRELQRSYDERWKINLCWVKKRHRGRQGRNNDRFELRYKFWLGGARNGEMAWTRRFVFPAARNRTSRRINAATRNHRSNSHLSAKRCACNFDDAMYPSRSTGNCSVKMKHFSFATLLFEPLNRFLFIFERSRNRHNPPCNY